MLCRASSASRPYESHSHSDSVANEPHYQQQHLTKDDEMIHDDKYEASLQSFNKHLLESEEERTTRLDDDNEFEDELHRAT